MLRPNQTTRFEAKPQRFEERVAKAPPHRKCYPVFKRRVVPLEGVTNGGGGRTDSDAASEGLALDTAATARVRASRSSVDEGGGGWEEGMGRAAEFEREAKEKERLRPNSELACSLSLSSTGDSGKSFPSLPFASCPLAGSGAFASPPFASARASAPGAWPDLGAAPPSASLRFASDE
jgi:hypothetical protein